MHLTEVRQRELGKSVKPQDTQYREIHTMKSMVGTLSPLLQTVVCPLTWFPEKRKGMERIKKEKGDQIPTFAFLHMELHSLPVTFF